MRNLVLALGLAVAGLSAKAQQVSFQERAYMLSNKNKYINVSAIDLHGNVLLSGLERINNNNPHNSIQLLLKPNTDTIWTRKGPVVIGFATQPGLRERVNGGFSLAASIPGPNTTNDLWDVALQKLGPGGSVLMSRTYNPAADHNTLHGFLTMPDNGYLIMGFGGIAGTNSNAAVMRTDSLGTILWQRNHGYRFHTEGADYMEHARHNRVIIAGIAPKAQITSPARIKLLLLNANGDSLKENTLAINSLNQSEAMLRFGRNTLVALSDGGYLLTCLVDTINFSPQIYGTMGVVAKVDSNLQVVWRHVERVNPASGLGIHFIKAKELNDGTLLVLGEDSQPNQFKLFHFAPFGVLMNTYTVTSNMFPTISAYTMEALPDSSLMIGGKCSLSGNISGFYIAKVKIQGLPPVMPPSVVLGTKPEQQAIVSNALGQSYPNPAQDQAIIPYNLPNSTQDARIQLRDITGREVGSYSLKLQQKQGCLPVNLSSFRNGLYLYSLVIDGKPVATRKLAVAR